MLFSTLPKRPRRPLWGMRARFSAQSVSITPASGTCRFTDEPGSRAEILTTGQSNRARLHHEPALGACALDAGLGGVRQDVGVGRRGFGAALARIGRVGALPNAAVVSGTVKRSSVAGRVRWAGFRAGAAVRPTCSRACGFQVVEDTVEQPLANVPPSTIRATDRRFMNCGIPRSRFDAGSWGGPACFSASRTAGPWRPSDRRVRGRRMPRPGMSPVAPPPI